MRKFLKKLGHAINEAVAKGFGTSDAMLGYQVVDETGQPARSFAAHG